MINILDIFCVTNGKFVEENGTDIRYYGTNMKILYKITQAGLYAE